LGDASKAREQLAWMPSLSFQGLVEMMVDADVKLATREAG
jgi:GDPmannose 4,6-dehydratase